MQFDMVSLLIHTDDVPAAARDALRAAHLGPPEGRRAALATAARAFHREVGLDCIEAYDIVGLPYESSCG